MQILSKICPLNKRLRTWASALHAHAPNLFAQANSLRTLCLNLSILLVRAFFVLQVAAGFLHVMSLHGQAMANTLVIGPYTTCLFASSLWLKGALACSSKTSNNTSHGISMLLGNLLLSGEYGSRFNNLPLKKCHCPWRLKFLFKFVAYETSTKL